MNMNIYIYIYITLVKRMQETSQTKVFGQQSMHMT